MALVSLGLGTVIAVILIVAVSWATNRASNSTSSSTPLATTDLVGTTVKDFSLPGLFGGTVPSPWASGHPSVVIFFASWCGPCQAEMPKVATWVSTHQLGDVRVIGVDANDQQSAARSFLTKDHVTFPVGFDANGALTSGTFRFLTLPETVFLTKSGRVLSVHFGAIPPKQLAAGITSLGA